MATAKQPQTRSQISNAISQSLFPECKQREAKRAVCLIRSFRVAQPTLARSLGMFVDSLVGYVESIESVVTSIKVAPNVHARPGMHDRASAYAASAPQHLQ